MSRSVGVTTGIVGTIIAPAAGVTLPALSEPHRGAVFAREVELEGAPQGPCPM